jgi:hypothetical protein
MVDLKSTNATPEQIANELKRYDIDARVVERPASPSGVGKFVTFTQNGQAIAEPSSTYFMHFSLADEKKQRVELGLGRTAHPGEQYLKFVSAYDRGELLHCSNTLGRQVKDVYDELSALHVDVTWRTSKDPNVPVVDVPPYNEYFITSAVSDKPNSIVVYFAPAPNPFVSETDCT